MAARFAWISCLLLATAGPLHAQAPLPEADTLSASIRTSARKVLPAVVTVRGYGMVPPPAPLGISRGQFGAWVGREPPPDLGGSGVVVDAARGLVLTNHHVVPDAPRLVVTLPDGRERLVKGVRRDPRSDLALLTIDPAGLVQAEWGDSDALDLGDWVLAVGQPFGLAGTVTAGIVSSSRRTLDIDGYEDLIQTSAAINPGSSGGPLIDLKGRIVGINVAIKSVGGGYEGVGFAVPGSRAKRVAADLAEFGGVRRAYLGIATERIPPETAVTLGVSGVRVVSIGPQSPAEVAGLLPGDLLLKINDRAVRSIGEVRSIVEFAPVDGNLSLTILREGSRKELSAKVAARPEDSRPSLR